MSKKGWIITIVFTAVVIFVWITSIIAASKPVPLVPEVQESLDPVDPGFDQDTIKQVRDAQKPAILAAPKNSTAPPSPTPSQTPKASPTASSIPFPRTQQGSNSAIVQPSPGL